MAGEAEPEIVILVGIAAEVAINLHILAGLIEEIMAVMQLLVIVVVEVAVAPVQMDLINLVQQTLVLVETVVMDGIIAGLLVHL